MMQKYKHSQVLFVRDDGLPMEFYIRAGTSQRLEVRSLIEHGGGIVRYTQGKGIIRLVPLGTKVLRVSEDGLTISVQFIYDCVARNRLLDTSSYVVRVLSAKTSDISDEDEDDFRKTKRPSAVPLIVHAKKASSSTISSGKSNEKAQSIKQKTTPTLPNGVREDAVRVPYNLGNRSSSSSTDHSDESMSLLQKKNPLADFKSPLKRTHQSNSNKSSASSKRVQQPLSKPSVHCRERSTSNQRIYSDSDSEVGSAELDGFDVSLLGKSRNYMRTACANQIDEPTACGSGTTRLAAHRTSRGYEENPNLAVFAPRDLSQPSSSNDTHVSPTPHSEADEDDVPYRREIDLSIVEAACVLKDIENLVLFCKLCEDSEATMSKVRQVNRLKRVIYKSIAAADAAQVLKKPKLSTYDKAVLFKYLLCEDNVHPQSATTLLSKFLDNDTQTNSKTSKKT